MLKKRYIFCLIISGLIGMTGCSITKYIYTKSKKNTEIIKNKEKKATDVQKSSDKAELSGQSSASTKLMPSGYKSQIIVEKKEHIDHIDNKSNKSLDTNTLSDSKNRANKKTDNKIEALQTTKKRVKAVTSEKIAKDRTTKKTDKNIIKPPTQKPKHKKIDISVAKQEATDGSKIHKIIIPNKREAGSSQFSPKSIRIKIGASVVWINRDTRTHFINSKEKFQLFSSYGGKDNDDEEDEEEEEEKSSSLRFNSPYIPKEKEWLFKFTQKGTYNYYCYTHPMEMKGVIIVE